MKSFLYRQKFGFRISSVCFKLFVSAFIVTMTTSCDNPNLHEALEKGDRKQIEAALNSGADANQQSQSGKTPIHVAITRKDTFALRVLLAHGANFESKNSEGKSALEVILNNCFKAGAYSFEKFDTVDARMLKNVMGYARRGKYNEANLDGKINIALEQVGGGDGSAFQFVPHTTFESGNKSFDVIFSQRETDYINVEADKTGMVLRPGQTYHIIGAQKNDTIEVTEVKYTGDPNAKNAMTLPFYLYLPSTMEKWYSIKRPKP